MKSKETLRKTLLAKRTYLTPEEIEEKSTLIAQKILALPEVQGADTVLSYCSKSHEVDTLNLIGKLLKKGRKVLVPLTQSLGKLEWTALTNLSTLEPGPFGVPEPGHAHIHVEKPPADVPVLVPLLGFTARGDRLGYGAGYFDRFLSTHTASKIGLAFELQHVDSIPAESHDVPLDIIITESGQYP